MIGQTVLHYAILEKLGEGGMGVVYKAQDTRLKRDVAVKFLPREVANDGEGRKRFEIEAQAAAALSHPNIATIYAIEDRDGDGFIAMEFVEGEDLKRRLASTPIGLQAALDIAIQIARGLDAAHAKGVVHRDIKSSNIMLAADNHVKIMDFGLAKLKDAQTLVTRAGTTLGTWAYMSPEQARAQPVDQRSDLWSFGVVAFEMLTGELPFKADSQAGWIHTILNDDPLAPSALDRRIPPQVDDLVLKLLAKDVDERFQTAAEALAGLEDARAMVREGAGRRRAKAIAVLPFDNVSPDPESDYFSDGLSDELIMSLSRLKGIRVASRTTSMQYKGTKKGIKTLGRELGVRYIVEGSVRRFGDKLRITAQLIAVEDDEQLWAETFKGSLADVFDIQEKVAKQIVDALMVKLTPTEKVKLETRATVNAEAFDLYLRARGYLDRWTKKNIRVGIELFEKVIELDPRYAAAHAGLGEGYAILYEWFEPKDAWLDKAMDASLKALAYDAKSAEARAALGLCYHFRGNADEALRHATESVELDPNNYVGLWVLARIYYSMRRLRDAVPLYLKAIEINPSFYTAHMNLRMAYDELGMDAEMKEITDRSGVVLSEYVAKHPDDGRARMMYAIVLAGQERPDDARTESERAVAMDPNDPVMQYNAACLYSRMGRVKDGVAALRNAVDGGYRDIGWLRNDPDLANLRHEAEYQKIVDTSQVDHAR